MLAISENELSSLRAEIASTFDTGCSILTKTTSRGSAGSIKTSYVSTPSRCRIDAKTPQVVQAGEATNYVIQWQITIPYNSSISTGDKIAVNNIEYQVIAVRPFPLFIRAICITL